MRIGSSTYSFKRLGFGTQEEEHRTLPDIIAEAPKYGLAGLELLAVQFESMEPAYLTRIKQLAVANGLDLYALSMHHNFVKADPEARRKEIDIVLQGLDMAERLGTPIMRVFGGRWETVQDFAELMERDGVEDPLPGHRYEEAIEWSIEAFSEVTKRAEEKGIVLALENHWGLTFSADGVLEILRGVDSPFFRVALDCGNFRARTYEQIEQLVPYTALVHAKCYHGGGIFYVLDIDYPRIIRMLKDAGYNGYLSIEFEGKAAPSVAIPAQVKILEEAIRRS